MISREELLKQLLAMPSSLNDACRTMEMAAYFISGDAKTVWECMGRKQSLPEPGECSWPDCGCDPHATKVIESLLEQGWTGPTPTSAI